jgi:hypothetical protein
MLRNWSTDTDTKSQSNDYVVGSLVLILIATRYEWTSRLIS